MNNKNQQKNSRPSGNDAKAFKAVIAAIEECRAKPAYDYQRIIICHTNRPALGPVLARHSGATLAGWAALPHPARVPAVFIVENSGDGVPAVLESIVFFVNQTRGVVVLVAAPQSADHWRGQWLEISARIRRRTHVTIEFTK